MSSIKDQIINHILKIEGGYVNDLDDSGGETNYGITISTARRYGYTGPMKDLSRELAYQIYSERYWDALELDAIEKVSPMIAEELADTGVNMGTARSAEFLQRCLNVLNNRESYYDDIKIDGSIGPKTLKAFNSYINKRNDEKTLFNMLNCLQGAFYITLAERRQKDQKFVYGWFKQRIEIA